MLPFFHWIWVARMKSCFIFRKWLQKVVGTPNRYFQPGPPWTICAKSEKPMDLKELTAEMNQFVTSKGWYQPGSPRPQTQRNLAVSLALEAAEVLEHFQWGDNTEEQDELGSELADVALYLLQLASVSNINLEDAILNKLEINYSRQWPSTPAAGGQP